MAHDLVLSGTTIAWYVTVVTSSRITYVLSVERATIQNRRKTCSIVICAKGKSLESLHSKRFVSSSVRVVIRSTVRFRALGFHPASSSFSAEGSQRWDRSYISMNPKV